MRQSNVINSTKGAKINGEGKEKREKRRVASL